MSNLALLLNSQAEVVAQLLINLGLASSGTASPLEPWPVWPTNLPSLPDNAMVVTDTEGTSDGRSMVEGELLQHYGVQIMLRAVDHPTGYPYLSNVRQVLSQQAIKQVVTVGGNSYFVPCCTHFGQVITIGKDVPQTKRSLFTLNFTLPIRQELGLPNN